MTCGGLALWIWLGEAGRMPSSHSAGWKGILDVGVICGNAGPAEGTREMSLGEQFRRRDVQMGGVSKGGGLRAQAKRKDAEHVSDSFSGGKLGGVCGLADTRAKAH